jgi:site-specific DNA-methyltransferase (adenine-specific)
LIKVSNQHVPDILDCIANLSSDEIFTPPDFANLVLDELPPDIWKNPDLKFLDPACKTGIFLRECARRLLIGLVEAIPDEDKRREHIFKNMLFGIAITELTGLVSRRSLYYSKDANSDYAVVKFDSPEGNIRFKRTEHDYVSGKCKTCNSPYENLERGEGRENYAYEFIHAEEVFDMKFDVIIGNPPYQLETGGFGAQATPIYQLFVEQAFRLKPRYVAMIIPSRWFSGGMGLGPFRKRMLDSTNFKKLVDFPDASEVFPGVVIRGGVCYFLWDKNYDGKCEVETVQKGHEKSSSLRYLGEHGDTFIRFNEAIPVIQRIQPLLEKGGTLEKWISPINPFGIPTNFKNYKESKFTGSLLLYTYDGFKYIEKSEVKNNLNIAKKWKVFIPKAESGNDVYPRNIVGKPVIGPPHSVCTMSYLVAGTFDSEEEAENYASYLRIKAVRFLIALKKVSMDVSRTNFSFVPIPDLKKTPTEKSVSKMFGITDEESAFIDTKIKDMN